MCGILGAFGKHATISEEKFQHALQAIRHRGPDGEGYFADDFCKLGHRRLAIIDLATGQQPMESFDRRYAIVFNGEIYNYRELKKECPHYPFQTHSDTEIILAGYAQWGTRVLEKLAGMFAFAIYDRQQKELFLARDPIGIKPLVYSILPNVILFASEIKALKVLFPHTFSLDKLAIAQYFETKFIPAPYTIYRHIFRLKAGSFARLGLREGRLLLLERKRYWQPLRQAKPSSLDALKNAIAFSVKQHLVADVDLGIFLSGGLDSTIITALASRLQKRTHTYTVGFKKIPQDPDLKFARLVAHTFQTRHQEILVDKFKVDELVDLIQALDEPFADPALIPSFILAQAVSRYTKVALSGDGGDEFFYGYRAYRTVARMARLRRIAGGKILPWLNHWAQKEWTVSHWRHRLAQSTMPGDEQFIRCIYFYSTPGDLQYILKPDFYQAYAAHHSLLSNFADFTNFAQSARRMDLLYTLPDYYLRKVDWTSMLNGLEVRVPFLTSDIIEAVNTLPVHLHFQGRQGKDLLRRLFAKEIPRAILTRPKQGFTRTWPAILGPSSQKILRHFLLSAKMRQSAIFQISALKQLVANFSPRRAAANQLLWRLLVFAIWYERHG